MTAMRIKRTYQVWKVEADATYLPILGGEEFPNKAKAIRLAKALAKSEAFSDCIEIGVVCGDMTVASFPVKRT